MTPEPQPKPRPQPMPVATFEPFLVALEARLGAMMADAGLLEQVAGPLVLARASKRARPLVAWLVGRALGADPAVVLDVAVAVELVHGASLLHDDVVDGASERRGLPSANARWGATIAVLSGDLLLTAALTGLRRLGPLATARAVDVVAEMTRAVAAEIAMRRRSDVALADWRNMAAGKTGALFGGAAWLVAATTGDLARAERFERALRHLGVAFQIADDVGDVASDLRDGNPSFPVLLAAQGSPATRAAIDAAWRDQGDGAALAEAIRASGALAAAGRQVHTEIAAARALLAPELGANSPGIDALLSWAESLATTAEAQP